MSQAALQQAVLANPQDDASRQVYADWLEEHGATKADRARAEFIRLQVERARLPEHDPRRPLLRGQEQELLDLHGGEWRNGLPSWLRGEQCWFRRGFIAVASMTAARFYGRGRSLAEFVPLEGVLVRNTGSRTQELASCPRLAGLRELTPVGRVDERVLFASPHLAGLKLLDVSQTSYYPGVATALAGASFTGLTALTLSGRSLDEGGGLPLVLSRPYTRPLEELDLSRTSLSPAELHALARASLPRLRVLRLGRNHMGDEEARILAEGDFPCLDTLDLTSNLIQGEGVRALLTTRWSAGLRCLRLRGNLISAGDFLTLAGGPALAGLVELTLGVSYLSHSPGALADALAGSKLARLELRGCTFAEAPMRALAGSAVLAGLWHLDLTENTLRPGALRALLAGPVPPQLRTLSLSLNRLRPPEVEGLVRSGWLARLDSLFLHSTDLDDEGAVALAGASGPCSLRELSLFRNDLGPAGARALARSPLLANLRSLSLGRNPLRDEGMAALASSPYLSNLQRLDLRDCEVGLEGILALARSPHLSNLAELDLGVNDLPEAALRALLDSPHFSRLLTVTCDLSRMGSDTVAAFERRFDRQRNLHV